jgi:hypothetical protein
MKGLTIEDPVERRRTLASFPVSRLIEMLWTVWLSNLAILYGDDVADRGAREFQHRMVISDLIWALEESHYMERERHSLQMQQVRQRAT